jgi:hypothetical protein
LKKFFLNFQFNEFNFDICYKLKELLFHIEPSFIRNLDERSIFLCLEDYWLILNSLYEAFPNTNLTLLNIIHEYENQLEEIPKLNQKTRISS